MRKVDRITFGMEIECYFPDRCEVVRGAYHSPNYLEEEWNHWGAQFDSSINSQNGTEFVSPIMWGKYGVYNVRAMAKKLNEAGARVNRSCGVHIHVGISSLVGIHGVSAEYIISLVRHFARHQKALFGIGGRLSRVGNRYCSPIESVWHSNFRGADKNRLASELSESTRASALNLTSMMRAQTAEFRLFAPTINRDKLTGYLYAALAICEAAAKFGEPELTVAQLTQQSANLTYLQAVERMHEELGWYGGRQLGNVGRTMDVYLNRVLQNQLSQSSKMDERAQLNSN